MSDFKTREFEASDLRKAGDFEKALSIYRDLWKDHEGQFNEWSVWSYAKCAQKCDEHDEAERIARVCVERWPDFPQGRQTLAWSHYYRHFRDDPAPNQPVPKAYWDAAEEVVELCAEDPHSQYAPFVRIVFKVVKRLEDQQATDVNVRKRIEWLGHLDPAKLGAQGDSFKGGDGKTYKVASDRENWYSHMSKALLDAGRYEECIALCEEALGQINKLHYDNDIWFGKRIAEAKTKIGRTEEALEDYKKLALKKPKWFLYYDIACLAHQLGQGDEALRYAADAALSPGLQHELGYRSKVFLLLAVLLRDAGQDDLAKQHAQLAASARSEEGWTAKGRTLQLFQEFEVETEGGPAAKGLTRGLQPHWKEWRAEALPQHEGEIDWVHHEKPFGFIKVDGQKDSVFFSVNSFKGPKDRLDGGTRVRFLLKESYDAKKDQMSNQAVDIAPIG